MEQLAFALFTDEDVKKCPHMGKIVDGKHVWCNRGCFWTMCTTPLCEEPPICAFDEPDNSPEARERRIEWMRTHKETKSEVLHAF